MYRRAKIITHVQVTILIQIFWAQRTKCLIIYSQLIIEESLTGVNISVTFCVGMLSLVCAISLYIGLQIKDDDNDDNNNYVNIY